MNDDEMIPDEILDKDPHFKELWGNFLEDERDRRIVKKDEIEGKKVSTVFIGIDHCWVPKSFP